MDAENDSDARQPQDQNVPPEPVEIPASSEEQGQDTLALAGQGQDVPRTAGTPVTGPAPERVDGDRMDRADIRARIVRRFETWLDDVLEGEPPLTGIAAEILQEFETEPAAATAGAAGDGHDLYSLWSAVTAMAEETRLQGRAFKQLHEGISPMQGLVESVGAVLQRYQTSIEEQDQRVSESTRQAVLKEVLGTLIDVRDRLVRGAAAAQAWLQHAQTPPKRSLGERLRRKLVPPPPQLQKEHEEAVRSLLKGYDLSREVLDEALGRLGVRPVNGLGRPFDPSSMRAVDLDSQSSAEDGTVLEVYRQGYWWNNAVYRPAEVKVARKRTE